MPVDHPVPAPVILVVEDDALVRTYVVETLEETGLEVVEARDADEAWEIVRNRSDIGVLFTDIDMPGSMCGYGLSVRVAEHYPTIRIILTSGRQRPSEMEVRDLGLFLPKPYRPMQVIEAIGHLTP